MYPCRRRPFLTRGLENTLIKLLLTTEFFDDANRRKIGIGERRMVTESGNWVRVWGLAEQLVVAYNGLQKSNELWLVEGNLLLHALSSSGPHPEPQNQREP